MSSMRIRWLVNPTASSLHAAAALAAGHTLTDSALARALAAPLSALEQELDAENIPAEEFWRLVSALSTTFDDSRQLAKMALYRTLERPASTETVQRIGVRIAQLNDVLRLAKPNLAEELTLRSGPIRTQWEARGPGLLKYIFSATEPRLMVDAADIVLVLPVLGGGGAAQLYNNSVRLEAVLADPHAELPEVARLSWLLAQLHLDLPQLATGISRDRLPHLAALAMLPVALEAAAELELIQISASTLSRAHQLWHLRFPTQADPIATVLRWWEAYTAARPPFEVALQSLDEMLDAAPT
jgi:hypothetical protein